MFLILFMVGSIVTALAVLFYPAPLEAPRPWKLRTSWALWCLQPALLLGGLLIGLAVRTALGYTSSDVPADVDVWLTAIAVGPVALGLLAGMVVGGLAWRTERLAQPPTSRRWWALAAMLANTLWFVGGAWLFFFFAPPVAIALDAAALVLLVALVLWAVRPARSVSVTEPDQVPAVSPDEHLVG